MKVVIHILSQKSGGIDIQKNRRSGVNCKTRFAHFVEEEHRHRHQHHAEHAVAPAGAAAPQPAHDEARVLSREKPVPVEHRRKQRHDAREGEERDYEVVRCHRLTRSC